jgi:ubiquitin-like protein Pup
VSPGQQRVSKETNTSRVDTPEEALPPPGERKPRRTKKVKKVQESLDEILEEIDEILEENAEEFVKGYVQKGGE